MSLGAQALEWMIRRHLLNWGALNTDLLLVQEHKLFGQLPAQIEAKGRRFKLARCPGELSLRAALLEGVPLLALIPEGRSLSLDLRERAWLRRPILLKAQDIVAAGAGRLCGPISESALLDRVVEDPESFAESAAQWTFRDPVVTEQDLRHLLLGLQRPMARTALSEILAAWLREGPPERGQAQLFLSSLFKHPLEQATHLIWVLKGGALQALVDAGALAGVPRLRLTGPLGISRRDEARWRTLRDLLEPALSQLKVEDSERAQAWLQRADQRARRANLSLEESLSLPLLPAAFELGVEALAREEGAFEDHEGLWRNLWRRPGEFEVLRQLKRLTLFVAQEAPSAEAKIEDWARFAREHVAWADWAARALRRGLASASEGLQREAKLSITAYLKHRDQLNRAFAERLAAAEELIYGRRSGGEGAPLHLLSRALIAPLVQAGAPLLLLVLDGCDLSTLLEIFHESLPSGLGLRLPDEISGRLSTELSGPLLTLFSPLPTLTRNGRRALFAGQIPNNAALQEGEAPQASADIQAFKQNRALSGISRKLLLKGALGDEAAPLIDALRAQEHQLLAAVFNVIDDALSSKERTALGPWDPAHLGPELLKAITVAVEEGWRVILTSDHGHTPFWSQERKRKAPRGSGQRWREGRCSDGVHFLPSAWRARECSFLSDLGAFMGGQRRGFHGGVSLEEVCVPVAFLGAVQPGEGRPQAPGWWS